MTQGTGGSVVEILFPELIQESLPSRSSAESGPWAQVIEYTHIHAQHSPYNTVDWQKQVVKGTTGSGMGPLYKYLRNETSATEFADHARVC
jgi:hypothetical protein